MAGGSSRTFARPIPLTVGNASNIVVQDISITNSPFWHQFVYQSTDVVYDNIVIRSLSFNASAPSANSDGWDIYRSSHVTIKNSNINNDDDWWVLGWELKGKSRLADLDSPQRLFQAEFNLYRGHELGLQVSTVMNPQGYS